MSKPSQPQRQSRPRPAGSRTGGKTPARSSGGIGLPSSRRGRLSILALLLAVAALILVPAVVFAAAPATPNWHGTDAVKSGDGIMTLTWLTASAATGYQYRYSNDSQAFFEIPGNLLPCVEPCIRTDWASTDGGTNHEISKGTLTVGTTYFFQIRAVNTNDSPTSYSDPSETRSGTQWALPAALSNLSATAGNAQVTLSWTAPPAGEFVINYDYRQDDGGGSGWGDWQNFTTTTNSRTVTELSNGTTYSFQVRANNSQGEGPDGDTVNATPDGPPDDPAELTAQASSTAGTEVTLNWTDPNDSNIDK